MDQDDVIIALIAALPGFILGVMSLWASRPKAAADVKKVEAETDKTDAETNLIYSQVADRWLEHVTELQEQVKHLELDISQVRRENETYRKELTERDLIISDLKDWAERLISQLAQHAPDVKPEQFYRRTLGETTTRRLRAAHPRYADSDSPTEPLGGYPMKDAS